MSLKLEGKVAVVTGASKGIGSAIAKDLAAAGAKVVVNYASDKAGADKAVSEIQAAGGQAIAVGGSVANAEDVASIFNQTVAAYGKVDILVNNAGIFVFGEVVEGMNVVDEIKKVATGRNAGHSDVPVKPVVIEKAELHA